MAKLSTIQPRVQTVDLRRGVGAGTERIRGGKLTKIRERILLRDLYTCRRCGRVGTDLVVDHIIPLHLSGREVDENRQLLCAACHAEKSEREERERGGL
jgi:5-methylcytosine-specific restriction protein A